MRVTGFPNRVDVLVTGLSLADPEAGWSWHAEEFQILSLAYRPHQFIVALPGPQVVGTPSRPDRDQQPAARLGRVPAEHPAGARPFDLRDRGHGDRQQPGLARRGRQGDPRHAPVGRAVRPRRRVQRRQPCLCPPAWSPPPAACSPTPSGRWRSTPPSASTGHGSAAPSRATTRCPERVDVRKLALAWASSTSWAAARWSPTPRATPTAASSSRPQLAHPARRRRAFRRAQPDGPSAVRAGLGLLAGLSGDADTLSVPLTFGDGRTRLGPIPIGPAPRLAMR